METNRIITGDSFKVVDELPDESVHAVVTDPPYGLAFMGRDWDDFEPKEYQEWCQEWAEKVKRVLKPGGHLLAFSGNRTHHRLFTGVEDAGFEIRDTVTFHYGSGFPKATDVAKVIDKRRDVDRDVVGTEKVDVGMQSGSMHANREQDVVEREQTVATSDDAKKWDGWKTGLKPATEFVVMARKPFKGATVDSVLEHGTGALNIDGARIDMNGETKAQFDRVDIDQQDQQKYGAYEKDGTRYAGESSEGRYPANVVFDEVEAERLDVKEKHTTGGNAGNGYEWKGSNSMHDGMSGGASEYEDAGGPSRYFYTSKASKSERTENGSIENTHPTVKPQDLMEWLVKLVTRENQIVLDPFCGSGTTCKAAKELNREFIGIEKQSKWADTARVRVGLTPNDPSVVRSNDNQEGLEAYTNGENDE